MSQQLQITGGAKVRDLNDVIIGTSGVLSSLAFNVANGVPKLDSNAKILVSQLPNSVMEYKGTWSAITNTPTLADGTGNQGDVYLCNAAATTGTSVNFGSGAIVFYVGDQVIYSGTIWQRASGASGTVTSVAVSRSGDALSITGSPITTSGTINLGFAGNSNQYINGAGNLTTFPTLISSIGLSMPSAFNVSNSPLTANGTIAVTGAGYPSQYIRGDGTLADFPTSGGGGSSVSYYLNGGTSQGTIGGVTYYEMSKIADTGTGVDFPKTGDGLIVSFLTDAGDPAQLNIPAGNWNYEIYASMSSNGGTPQLYAELYVYDGTTFTLISTSSNEILYDGVNLNLYTFAMTVPATTLALTDRLAVKIYATNSGGKTTTVHTQDSHLCQIITTFSTGITALNGLTAQVQYFATGTSGTDFNISSTTATHTFNLPVASATNTGKLSNTDWSTFNNKVPYTGAIDDVNLGLYSLISNSIKVIGDNSTYGGTLSIKQNNVTSLIGTGYTELFGKTNRLGISFGAGSIAYLSNSTLTAERTYTLPDASGTIALVGGSGVGTVTSVAALTIGTSGTDLSSTVANSTTTPVITLNVPTASATNRGVLASADWTTFNNKQSALTNPVLASGTWTSGYLPKINGTYTIGNSIVNDNGTGIGIGIAAASPFILNTLSTDATTNSIIGIMQIGRASSGTAANGIGGNIQFTAQDTAGTQRTAAYITWKLAAASSASPQGYLAIGTRNASEALRIDDSGNLGLGVTPSAWGSPFVVSQYPYGSYFGGTTTGGTVMGNNNYYDGTNYKYINADFAGQIQIGGGNILLRVAASGAAAGTVTFTNALTIASTGAATFSSSVTANGLRLNGGDTTNTIYAGSASMGITAEAGYNISIGRVSDTTKALNVNTTNGNVGIGTSSPSRNLHVSSSGSETTIAATRAGTDSAQMGVDSVAYCGAGGDYTFRTGGFGTGNERMRITSSGKFAFGMTTTDYGIFSIKSNNTTAYMGVNVYANGNSNFIYMNHNNNVGIIGTEFGTGGTGHTPLTFQVGGSERMRIDTSGNVTFGITSAYDTALLWRQDFTGGIHGRIYATGAPRIVVIAGESNGVQLTSGATSWTSNSDERLKNINGTIENAIEKLLTLRTVNFSWKSDETKKQNLGLIAQDVEKEFPELIDKYELPKYEKDEQIDTTEYLGIRYTELIPVLVKAIQEQQAQIEELKALIAAK